MSSKPFKIQKIYKNDSLYLLNCFCHTKIALLEERERLEKSWKQEQLLKSVPSVRAELVEAKCGDSEDEQDTNTN